MPVAATVTDGNGFPMRRGLSRRSYQLTLGEAPQLGFALAGMFQLEAYQSPTWPIPNSRNISCHFGSRECGDAGAHVESWRP